MFCGTLSDVAACIGGLPRGQPCVLKLNYVEAVCTNDVCHRGLLTAHMLMHATLSIKWLAVQVSLLGRAKIWYTREHGGPGCHVLR